jgi:hypothetical protein
MNKEEKELLEKSNKMLENLIKSNENFKNEITTLINTMNGKVEQKHIPIHFENDILSTVQSSLNKAIEAVLTGYNSPLLSLVSTVINSHSNQLKEIISSSFNQVIQTDDFKKSIITAFSHKVAKTIISNNDGLFDKVANELKTDAIFKSKMAIAVSNVVEECMKTK